MPKDEHQEHRGRVIRTEFRTTATPQQAWEAWADPEKIAQWFTDRATGEAVPGGTITWYFDRFNYVIPYEVLEAVPGERFSIKWSGPGRVGILEVIIERDGGETLVRLVNSGFQEAAEWDEEYEGVDSGWRTALAILKYYLENHFGQPKADFLALRPASFSYEQLRPYFLEPTKLAQWLTKSGSMGASGEACHLTLRNGGELNGRVLAITKWEVALSWEEIAGTLELKGFSMGPQRMVGIRGLSWKLPPAEMKQVEDRMGTALERLAGLLGSAAAAAKP